MERIRNFFKAIARFFGFEVDPPLNEPTPPQTDPHSPKPDYPEILTGGGADPIMPQEGLNPNPPKEAANGPYTDLEALVEAIGAAWREVEVELDSEWPAFRQAILESMRSGMAKGEAGPEDAAVLAALSAILERYPFANQIVMGYYVRFEQALRQERGEDAELTDDRLPSPAAEPVLPEETVEPESVEESVLEDIFLEEDAFPGMESEPLPSITIDEDQNVSIEVFFATDRALNEEKSLAQQFENRKGDGTLRFGRTTVSIPDNHKMGELESPNRWLFQSFDPRKHFTVLTLDLYSQDRFRDEVSAALDHSVEGDDPESSRGKEALVFIHGYNVSFQGGLRRTAQIAYDLQFRGVPIFYSWPSAVKTLKYWDDEESNAWSQPHFDHFLRFVLTEVGAETVHIIAHSMGNRLLTNGLSNLKNEELPAHTARLRQILFTAPDVDARTFKDLAAAYEGKADRFTLYASSRDFALEVSSMLHGGNRAGEADGEPLIAVPVETIDVSDIDTVLTGLGHSYYGDNMRVLQDMLTLIQDGLGPDEREGLVRVPLREDVYWQFDD